MCMVHNHMQPLHASQVRGDHSQLLVQVRSASAIPQRLCDAMEVPSPGIPSPGMPIKAYANPMWTEGVSLLNLWVSATPAAVQLVQL